VHVDDVGADRDVHGHRDAEPRGRRQDTDARELRLLRSIESMTKQKIEVATVPTVSDLRARRLELTSTSIREQLVAGDLDSVRVVVQSLANEFDVVDVAAAAVKLVHAHLSDGQERDDRDVPSVAVPREVRGPRPTFAKASTFAKATADRSAGRRSDAAGTARIYIGAGRQAGIRPADLVGAITNEAGIASRELGVVQIADRFSIVEVPEEAADSVIEAMKRASLRGQRVTIRRDRED